MATKKTSSTKRATGKPAKAKAGKKPAASKRRTSKAAVASAGGVTVRMFCQGLGDCFLITIPQAGARVYSILIDCGVAIGTPSQEALMKTVVEEVVTLTGGSPAKKGTVDLLVVTHQHWDHVSGFLQAPDALKGLTFKHLWMAWTESETDSLAKQLRKEFEKAKLAIDGAVRKAVKLGAGDPRNAARLAGIEGVMSFFGPPLGAAGGKAKEAKGTLADAMSEARKLVGNDKDAIECLLPGHTSHLPGAASGLAKSIQAIVLGPPHDRAKLVRINPRESKNEAYEKHKGDAPGLAINAGWSASILHADDGDGAVIDPEFDRAEPFDSSRGRSWKEAQDDPYFRAHYFDDGHLNKGRRIDGEWLWSGAQRLALQMDSYTNNTSLVIAFELPKSKDVLLFVGDAQIGNWLSWHDQPYKTVDGRELTAAQLLARTVLYKVGHHGSHNATLREQGFELMNHPELVAMLPVEAEGVTRLGYGQMPLKSLVDKLHEHTSGRVLRVDKPWTGDKPPGTWTRPGAHAKRSKRTISVGKPDKLTQRPLYLEVVIPDR
ncbi:MAG TPA: MBL fold metallo-hydrolase [Thermoanaerobaculia bacterium]|nr:MBL fold metallo-hydrolase [Thermoanaerobaculia bacterium]